MIRQKIIKTNKVEVQRKVKVNQKLNNTISQKIKVQNKTHWNHMGLKI